MLDAVVHSVEPKTVYDLMMVKDITDKYWEEIRLRRSAAALIDGAYVDALALLLEPFCSMPDVPTDIARRYCDGDKVAKQRTPLVWPPTKLRKSRFRPKPSKSSVALFS